MRDGLHPWQVRAWMDTLGCFSGEELEGVWVNHIDMALDDYWLKYVDGQENEFRDGGMAEAVRAALSR